MVGWRTGRRQPKAGDRVIGLNPARDCILRPVYKRRQPTSGDKEVWALWTAGCFYGGGGHVDGWPTKAAIAQRQYEAQERAKQVERERIAAEQWAAAEKRREEAKQVAAREEAKQVAAREEQARLVRQVPMIGEGSLKCGDCGLGDQSIWLPVPTVENYYGAFTHECSCGTVHGLRSRQLEQECAELRTLMGRKAA